MAKPSRERRGYSLMFLPNRRDSDLGAKKGVQKENWSLDVDVMVGVKCAFNISVFSIHASDYIDHHFGP
jgi:hypothetical protein